MSSLANAASRAAALPLGGLRALGAGLRTLAILTLALVMLVGAYLAWGRDLPLFRVGSVEVVGTEDGLIVSTLTAVARQMTTLHVRDDRLDEAARQFPVIASIDAEPSFPTGMRLVVEIREPVARARLASGRVMPVAADGTLLPGVEVPNRVPTVDAKARGPVLIGEAHDQVRVIGAAPAPLARLIDSVSTSKETGVAVALEGGVEVRFGTPAGAERKWASAAAVLADDQITSLTYVDVSAPERPSVGGAVGGPAVEVELTPDATAGTPEATTVPEGTESLSVVPETASVEPETGADGAVAVP